MWISIKAQLIDISMSAGDLSWSQLIKRTEKESVS